MSGLGRRVLLDDRCAGALLRDHDEAPEGLARRGDADVERLLELDALRNDDEQAVLPQRRVVGRELLVPADERVEPLVLLGQRREGDPLGRLLDVDPVGGDGRVAGDVEVEHRLDLRGRSALERVRVEAAQVGEAPVLLGRVRERQSLVCGERVATTHTACTCGGGGSGCPPGSLTPAPLQTPESHISPTSSALRLELGLRGRDVGHAERDRRRRERGELVLVRVRRHHRERDVRGLVLDPILVVEVLVARQPERLAVELLRSLDVVHRDADVVDARDLHQGVVPSR